MKLSPLIQRIRATCPDFANRVTGHVEFAPPEGPDIQMPAAYVVPLDDRPGRVVDLNEYGQAVRDAFAVVVAVSVQEGDGHAAVDEMHAHRAALWRALLGWEPDEDYGWIEYEGGTALLLEPHRLYCQFRFAAETSIAAVRTGQGRDLENLPDFGGTSLRIDAVDPADPNLSSPGPDGRVEAGAIFNIPTT